MVKVVERSVLLECFEGPESKEIEATAPESRHATVPWLAQLAIRVRNGEISLERAMLAVKWIGERNGRQEAWECVAVSPLRSDRAIGLEDVCRREPRALLPDESGPVEPFPR